MEGKGTIALLIGGSIAVWAFLSLNTTHDTERAELRANIAVESAKIDRDFATTLPLPGDEKKINEAEADLAKAREKLAKTEAAAEATRIAEQADRDAVREENLPPSAAAQRDKVAKGSEDLSKKFGDKK